MSSGRIKGKVIQVGESYVLPIEQTKVTQQQAKVQKIIAETDAKAEVIISNAENKSQIIVQAANTEADKIIVDARAKAQDEYESVKQQAYQEGFQQGIKDGLEQFKKDAQESLQSLDVLAKSTFEMKHNIIQSATVDIVELITEIAKKVCQANFDSDMLFKITTETINLLNNKESITIIVNPSLVENITKLLPSIKQHIPKLQSVKITEDASLSSDGVIIETLDTRLDSRISSQITEIARSMLMGADDELEQE